MLLLFLALLSLVSCTTTEEAYEPAEVPVLMLSRPSAVPSGPNGEELIADIETVYDLMTNMIIYKNSFETWVTYADMVETVINDSGLATIEYCSPELRQ
jgi:hypothetical protein